MGGGFDISILSVPDAGYSRNVSCVPHLYLRFYLQQEEYDATSGAGTAYPSRVPESTPVLYWDSFYSMISFMCKFCRSLFVRLSFFFWPLCCLSFFDLRILITPLVFSTLFYTL
jgi:hypothetical protein